MKIVFIDPPQEYLMQERTQAPLGLMYMGAVLREYGHEVVISQPDSGKDEDLEKDIEYGDLYGISTTSLGYDASCDIARFLKRKRIGAKVIIGGYHVTCEPCEVEKEELEPGVKLWDAICTGEAEKTILKIVEDVEKNQLKRIILVGKNK